MVNKVHFQAAAMAFAALSASAAIPASASDAGSAGLWRNPQDSVHVEAHPCGSQMCGKVIWANDKAKADAKRGGTEELVGLELFRDFTQAKDGTWHGKVFVPDLNRTFSGTLRSVEATVLKGTGCLMGRIGCRSQLWTRVP